MRDFVLASPPDMEMGQSLFEDFAVVHLISSLPLSFLSSKSTCVSLDSAPEIPSKFYVQITNSPILENSPNSMNSFDHLETKLSRSRLKPHYSLTRVLH